MKYIQKIRNIAKGFSLLEVVVALGLFSIFSVFVVGSYISVSSLERTIGGKQKVASEIRFALDTLGREITWAVALPDCDGCDHLRFAANPRPDTVVRVIEYRHDAVSQNVVKAETKPFGPCTAEPASGDAKNNDDDTPFPAECYQKVFSDSVKISSFQFFVANNVDSKEQVVVTVAVKGSVTVNGKIETFSVSSTFTPRIPQNSSFLGGSFEIYSMGSAACSSQAWSFTDWTPAAAVDLGYIYNFYECHTLDTNGPCDPRTNAPTAIVPGTGAASYRRQETTTSWPTPGHTFVAVEGCDPFSNCSYAICTEPFADECESTLAPHIAKVIIAPPDPTPCAGGPGSPPPPPPPSGPPPPPPPPKGGEGD
ncbi:prepilin-type N-terminal cleavage/methylation domain-containing protein [bacterium]|nr:prepilin-type N-terminal cleavage/methylation domain-containing protein [bacterium]